MNKELEEEKQKMSINLYLDRMKMKIRDKIYAVALEQVTQGTDFIEKLVEHMVEQIDVISNPHLGIKLNTVA